MMSPDEQKSKEGIILTEEDIEIVYVNVLELNNAIFRENLILGNVIQETDFNEVINAHRNSNIEINQPLRLTDLQNYRITINSKLKRKHWQQKAYYTESMLDFQERQKIQILIESGDFEEANRLFLENGSMSDEFFLYLLKSEIFDPGNIQHYTSDRIIKIIHSIPNMDVPKEWTSDLLEILKINIFDPEKIQHYTSDGITKIIDTIKDMNVPTEWIFDLLEIKKQKIPLEKIEETLNAYDFLKADKDYSKIKQSNYGQDNYERDKAEFIQKYFKKELGIENLDQEQAEAIGALGNKVLVSARAGSGKTQTISSKVTLLTEKYNIKPDQILVLCFNSPAAGEMQSRIRENIPNFNSARTFHSWAWSIVKPGNSILFDSGGQFSPKEFSKFIKSLINDLLYRDKDFSKEIYNFFREESEYLSSSLSETKEFSNETDRYLFLRNQTEISLNGTRTKSSGEKWIADFLFEHGIDFFYERHLTWYLKDQDDRPYHPDFTFEYRGRHYVLEHWGIDEYDFRKKVPEHWHKTWDEYHIEMNRKRDYFSTNRKYKLLETSIRDINYSLPIPERRRDFENKFKKKLESHGIYCQKLSTEQLIAKAWKKNMFNLLHELSGQFIGWIEKLELSEQDIINILERGGYNDRQKKFCEIGMKIYKMYLEKLDEKKKIDFNLLVSSATQKIKNGEIDVSHLKYILIDEFQDFSQLFQNLIDATTKANPEINLFCVGDPWQLINGFAGSNPDLFYNFSDIANNKTISTCYRSTNEIVENANKFANKHSVFIGTRGESNKSKNEKGFIISKIIDSVEITNDNKDEGEGFMEDNQFKKYFRKEHLDGQGSFMPDNQYINAGYLKYATEIVQDNPDSSFLFLYRNKDMHGMDIYEDFQGYLKSTLQDEEIAYERIEFRTVHSSKGKQADIVVILNLVEGTFPSIHPSNQFFEIFGLTPSRVLDEEKRLFYVAITRAKRGLYVISEAGKVSDFFDGEYLEETKKRFNSDLPF